MFSYAEIKGILYALQTLLGAFLISIAWHFYKISQLAVEPISYQVPALVLFLVGSMCIFYGVITFCLREDPDIWR